MLRRRGRLPKGSLESRNARNRRFRRRRLATWLAGTVVLASVAVASVPQPPVQQALRRAAPVLAERMRQIAAPVRPLIASVSSVAPAFPLLARADAADGPDRERLFDDPALLWRSAFEGLGQPFRRVVPVGYAPGLPATGSPDALYRPPSPDMWLSHVGPPYVLSEPGGFELRIAYVASTIEHSLFQAGQEAGLSELIILRLAEIFGWDIDFALDVEAGDSFSVIYEEKYLYGQKIADGAILAAQFSNQGRIYRAIGFRNEAGNVGYYTPDGRNLRRAFLRTPVKFSRVSSRFSASRYHPILKTWRAHRGVDYAAPAGTPVRATAGGKVVYAGTHGGYGKMVMLDHGGVYQTLYAHLSRLREGLEAGERLRQGEIIGYVGESGLATGPHLHYEFRVNGMHENPLTFDFPAGAPIAPPLRDEFDRVATEWTARLDLVKELNLASGGPETRDQAQGTAATRVDVEEVSKQPGVGAGDA